MNDHFPFIPFEPIESQLHSISYQLRVMKEQLILSLIDDDGKLRETAAILRLKRGCRR